MDNEKWAILQRIDDRVTKDYFCNDPELELINNAYKEIENLIDIGIAKRIKKPIKFLSIPIGCIFFIMFFNFPIGWLLLFTLCVVTYFYSKLQYNKIINLSLDDLMNLESVKSVISCDSSKNFILLIESCTYLTKEQEYKVNLESLARRLNLVIRKNRFDNKFKVLKGE
ncbi:hypothetical protein [Mannheimia haemolytica]|uniref:hypothetical protein n=1 Tax=Mannheimia haemolytica TaxID=75985 RepID=UPI00201BE1AF|nr:hypothetical protein [Mannheimia haemolytica]MDW0617850.1 hypothetical protein [Mannheimia haemolytica]UQX68787.1 hypothetical protein M3705_07165 [Mannheimia haemolytica]